MSPAPPKLVSALWNRVPEPLRRRLESPEGRRLLRFAPAAVLALAATQITYFICVSVAPAGPQLPRVADEHSRVIA